MALSTEKKRNTGRSKHIKVNIKKCLTIIHQERGGGWQLQHGLRQICDETPEVRQRFREKNAPISANPLMPATPPSLMECPKLYFPPQALCMGERYMEMCKCECGTTASIVGSWLPWCSSIAAEISIEGFCMSEGMVHGLYIALAKDCSTGGAASLIEVKWLVE